MATKFGRIYTEVGVDDRLPKDVADDRIAQLRAATTAQMVADGADDVAQRNAVLGVLDAATAKAVTDAVSLWRGRYIAARDQVYALRDGWDKTEATRVAVCDAIEAVSL